MPKSLGELSPLVPHSSQLPASSSSSMMDCKKPDYKYYDDDYTPIDEASRQMLRRRRLWIRLGQSLVAAAVIIVVAHSLWKGSSSDAETAAAASLAAAMASVKEDHLFAGLLADDKAFYFPTERGTPESPVSRRRFLRALATADDSEGGVNWSYDWEQNKKDAAAIGEYYRSKGMALASYYRSKYDPTYKADIAGDADAAAGTDDEDADSSSGTTDAWTDDWKADKARGLMLGRRYQAIGNAIDEHYRKAFNSSDSDDGGDDEFAWQSDRELGSSIGDNYKSIGKAIEEHYQQAFDDDKSKDGTAQHGANSTYLDGDDDDWATKWKQYKKKGQEIANYYKSKGEAIDEFYKGKYSLEGMAPPTEALLESAAVETPDKTSPDVSSSDDAAAATTIRESDNPANYVWGLDWQNDRDHAIAVHRDIMKKGMSIHDYYRAKYDPTYRSTSAAPAAVSNNEPAAGDSLVPRNPDLDFPPWGVDHEADRRHGLALHEYWKKQHEIMRAQYKKKGDDLGNYYENFYRSKFDPTYVSASNGKN